MNSILRVIATSMLGLGLGACQTKSSDSSPSEVDGTFAASTGAVDGACPQETRAGRFVVDQTVDYAFVDGQLLDGVVPTSVRTEVYAEGDCRILRRENPFCDPPCGGDETCVDSARRDPRSDVETSGEVTTCTPSV